jgi:hypothetical protein
VRLQLVVSPALRGHFAENTEGESSTKNIRRELNEDSSSHQLPKDIERLPRSALGTESVYSGLRNAIQLSVPILGNILGVTPWDSDIYSMAFESERRLGVMPVLTWKTPTPQATRRSPQS